MQRKPTVYKNKRTQNYSILPNSKWIGPHIIGDEGVVAVEDAIPEKHYPMAPTRRPPARLLQRKEQIAYVYIQGIVFYVVTVGKPVSGTVSYKKLWPVLKQDFPSGLVSGDLEGLTDRIIRRFLASGDKDAIDTYLVRGENFWTFKNKAWYADRFNLYSGTLLDGKHFKGTVGIVPGVPKDSNPQGNYNHITNCSVYDDGGSYQMFTEERRMKIAGQGSGLWNYRAVINRYTSADLENWAFASTVREDIRIDPKDYNHSTPLRGLPVSFLPKTEEHIKSTVAAGNETPTDLSTYLSALFPSPGQIRLKSVGGLLRAWLDYWGNDTYVSTDGVNWAYESTGYAYMKDGTRLGSGASVLGLGKKV